MTTSTRAKVPPIATRYEDDLCAWVDEQVALLRAGQLDLIDAENIAEELGDVAKSERRALESAIAVLAQHLLKWDHQSTRRSISWQATVNEQRRQVSDVLKDSPSLKSRLPLSLRRGYADGRDRAVADTNLPYATFPEDCPYSFDELMTRPIEYVAPPAGRRKSTAP